MDRSKQARHALAKAKLKEAAPRRDLTGDLTRPHLSRFLDCKEIDRPANIDETPAWWKPAKHGMEVKSGKAKQARSR